MVAAGDLGGAAKLGYAGDAFSFEIAGIVYEHDDGGDAAILRSGDDPATTAVETTFVVTPAAVTSSDDGTGWQVAAGIGFGLSDMAKVSVSAAIGDEPSKGDYWNASAYLGFTLTETVNLQFGASYADYEDLDVELTEFDVGLYYNPVDQLTLGLEAAWADGLRDFYGDETTNSRRSMLSRSGASNLKCYS